MDSCETILKTSNLDVDRNVCVNVASYISKRQANDEVEVRFGYIENGKRKSGIAPSNGKSSREIWYELMKTFASSKLYTQLPIEKTRSETYGEIRRITNLTSNVPDIFQIKKRVNTLDILSFKVGSITNVVRFSQSTEIPTDTRVSGNPDNVRIKTRVSFLATDKVHRIDMTFVQDSSGESYEVEIEYLTALDRSKLSAFFAPVKIVCHILKGTTDFVTTSHVVSAIKTFNDFFPESTASKAEIYKRAFSQPVNLPRNADLTAYSVTSKFNGTRMVCVTTSEGVYVINMRSEVLKIGSSDKTFENTVFDGEFFKDSFYIFDTLFYKGRDVRNTNHDIRLEYARMFIELLKNPRLLLKTFYMSPSIESDIKEALEYNHSIAAEDTDGLIFTPITLPYNNKYIYKWKPPHELTIDFKAEKMSGNRYKLLVGSKNNANVPFMPDRNFNGVITSDTPLPNIGEYRWEGNTFVLVRARPDKVSPNYIDIAKNVWNDIMDPITENDLPILFSSNSSTRDSYRAYHNSIKRDLIHTYFYDPKRRKTVLDLGAGKGGDLSKYAAANVGHLFAIEPNTENVTEFKRRVDMFNKNMRVTLEVAKAQDTEKIKTLIRGSKLDGCAMFFSLSFFFENVNTLRELLITIDQTIDIGGHFIGTTIDGEATRALLGDKDSVKLGQIEIKRKYNAFNGPIKFGKTIEFVYKNSATVSESQTEWLVDWNLFVDYLANYGFALQKSAIFSKRPWLTENENTASGLYRYFVFERTKHVKGARLDSVTEEEKTQIRMNVALNQRNEIEGYRIVKSSGVLRGKFAAPLVIKAAPQDPTFRVSAIADGNCFFHSIYCAIDRKYQDLDENEKGDFIDRARYKINITKAEWEQIPGIPHFLFQKEFISELTKEGVDEEKIDEISVNLEKNSTNSSFNRYTATARRLCNENEIDDDIVSKSIDIAFENFSMRIKRSGVWADQTFLYFIGNYINRDIIVINTDGTPYKMDCSHIKNRKTVLIHYVAGVHYEPIFRVGTSGKFEREFEADDPMIVSIRKEACKKD